jgi:TolA-binding protein
MGMTKSLWKTAAISGIFSLLLIPSLLSAQDNSYDKAITAYMKKDFKTASKILKEYVDKKPDPHAYYLLGYALYKQKKHAESAKYFEEAYVLDPNIRPYFNKIN